MIREIASGDAARIPVSQPHLVKSPSGDFLRKVVETHPTDYRNDQEWGDHFATVAEYLTAHPNVAPRERPNANQFPYFEALRLPSKEELLKRVASCDGITRLLLEADVPPEAKSPTLSRITNSAVTIGFRKSIDCVRCGPSIWRSRTWEPRLSPWNRSFMTSTHHVALVTDSCVGMNMEVLLLIRSLASALHQQRPL